MSLVTVLQELGGAARFTEIVEAGVTRRQLAGDLVAGVVAQPVRGVYCLPGAERADVTTAVRLRGVLSCGAAAQHHGLEVFGSVGLHVTARATRASLPGVVLHRRCVPHDARATRLLRTVLDCCLCLPANQAVLESAARVLLVEGDVGTVQTQVAVDRVGWVDFLVDGWLVVETDGWAVHRGTFREDRRRDAELVRQGYLVLRFTYDDVERRSGWVLDVVRDTLRREGPAHRRARER